jgi:hypothetical protein
MVTAIGAAAGAEADIAGFFVLRSFGMRLFSTIVGTLAMIVTLAVSFAVGSRGSYSISMATTLLPASSVPHACLHRELSS